MTATGAERRSQSRPKCRLTLRGPVSRWVWVPLLLTLLVRAVWLEWFPTDPIAPVDAEGFHLLAANWMAGRGFAIGWSPPFCPTAIRTPLYPLFLSVSYLLWNGELGAVVAVQLLLEVLTAASVIALARGVLAAVGSRGSAAESVGSRSSCSAEGLCVPLLAGLLYALNGTTQRYTGYLLSETLLLPLSTLALYWTVRLFRRPSRRSAVAAAFLWALALLAKPNIQFLILAVGGLLILRLLDARLCLSPPQRRGVALFFWVGFTALIFPWALRNHLVLGRLALSTAFEENLARVSAVATLAELEGIRPEPWSETWEYLYSRLAAGDGVEMEGRSFSDADLECDARLQQKREIASTARSLVLRHPGAALRAHLRGVIRSLLDSGHRLWYHIITQRDWAATGVVPDIWQRMGWSLARGAVGDALAVFWSQRVLSIPPLAGAIWWGLTLARGGLWFLGGRGAFRLRDARSIALLLVGLIAYHMLLPGPIAHDRLYLPAIPVVTVLVALGATGYNGSSYPPPDLHSLGGHHD